MPEHLATFPRLPVLEIVDYALVKLVFVVISHYATVDPFGKISIPLGLLHPVILNLAELLENSCDTVPVNVVPSGLVIV
jgi:hypothetical protein